MPAAQFSWNAIDLAEERRGEMAEDFDKHLAEVTKRQAAAMRTNALIGHQQTLESLAEGLAHRLSRSGVTEQLIRTALTCGPLGAGQILMDLITKCVDADAELAALAEIERCECAGGLDFSKMVCPDVMVPA